MDVRIDTLRLRVGGIGEDSARRLAGLITQGLSLASPTVRPGSFGRVGITVQAHDGDTVDDLANSAAAAVLRAIPAPGAPARNPAGEGAP